ncbi:MAG: hypothetical protein V3V14_07225, partial [Saprospiraceae bacterium]
MNKIILILCFLFSINSLVVSQSCDVSGVSHSTFTDVTKILNENNCASCHRNGNKKGGWNFDSYNDLLSNGDCDKEIIKHGNAVKSYLFKKLSLDTDDCSNSNYLEHQIPINDLEIIESWINFGAPELCVPLYSDIVEMFDHYSCNDCHNKPNSWRYDIYSELIGTGVEDDLCGDIINVVYSNASESLLYDKINNDGIVSCGEVMDGLAGAMSNDDIIHVRDWINSGAPESAQTLPVELASFTIVENRDNVNLKWTTEVEVATEKFVIERSGRNRLFESIGFVDAESNGNIKTDYSFIDNNPMLGNNYYRLRIVDIDGRYDYSNIRFIDIDSENSILNVFPNPAKSKERIVVDWVSSHNQNSANFSIVSITGEYLYKKLIFKGANF